VSGKPPFRTARFSERWKRSYVALSAERQRSCDTAVMALIKGEAAAGRRIKPIHPDKYYLEARVNKGDRIVFREEAGELLFIDVIGHDLIDRYGRKRG